MNAIIEEIESIALETITGNQFQLIVWNDDVNTFDWVIKTLMEVCYMTHEQAEQCSLLIHFKGKCSVSEGSYDFLKEKCDAITDRGIGSTVEERVV